jgi:hypothetical protein
MNQRGKKTPCESRGHVWVATASPLFDRCARSGCHAMRRYQNGQWVQTQANPSHSSVPPAAQQSGFWEEA